MDLNGRSIIVMQRQTELRAEAESDRLGRSTDRSRRQIRMADLQFVHVSAGSLRRAA